MISVTILTKNAERTLKKTLDSTSSFAEVLILDTGSTDRTLEIASEYPNVKIEKAKFIGFGPLHNLASSLASHDWILSLDSDESLSPLLIAEIRNLTLDPECIYSFERQNSFNGKHIKGCSGWYPDRVIRLYHRKKTEFTHDLVHEKILIEQLKEIVLKQPAFHTPYLEIDDFLTKMQTYSSLFARQYSAKKEFSLWKAILHGWFAFFKSYFLKRGFLAGKEGFIISAYNGHTTYYKYLKLDERNRKR